MKPRTTRCIIYVILLLLVMPWSILAKDFGIQGQTFSIQEQNLKSVLQEKMSNLSAEELAKRYRALGEKAVEEKKLFQQLPSVEEASYYRSYSYDPSIILEEDLLDAEGTILFKKGTHVNPLEHITLDSGLLFFNGDNPKHIQWAESQQGEFKWILTNGNPLKLQEKKDRPVFFDQRGFYTKKFQIKKVPCRVMQAEKVLLIEEIPIKRES